jgi:hypothetical protein
LTPVSVIRIKTTYHDSGFGETTLPPSKTPDPQPHWSIASEMRRKC